MIFGYIFRILTGYTPSINWSPFIEWLAVHYERKSKMPSKVSSQIRWVGGPKGRQGRLENMHLQRSRSRESKRQDGYGTSEE